MILKTSKSSRQRRFKMFIGGFVKICDGITPVLTLGFYWTDFAYRYNKAMFLTKQSPSGISNTK